MKTRDFTTSIITEESTSRVFKAILNFRAWWSEEIEGETDKLGESFFYHYRDIHLCKIKLSELIPDRKLVYHILDNHFSFISDPKEWVDTKLIFEISKEGYQTKLNFTHEGLNATHECYDICHESWTNYINKSLYNFITTGKGNPNPKEDGGFNAEIVTKWKLEGGQYSLTDDDI